MYQSKSSLEVAVEAAARVDAVLAKKGKIKPNPIATVLATANKSTTDLFQTEFEINDVPLTARNLLTKGITQEEINHFSGASISTRGRYVTPEDRPKLSKSDRPLYLYIQGPNKQSLDLAIQRIDSLIKEVMEQEKFKMAPPTVITIQTSLPGMEKVIVGLESAPPSFDLRNKVLGPNGANLQYISNETGAIVTLRGRSSGYLEANTGQESLEPLHICVEHQKLEVLQAARQLAFNLVDTIQQEFAQLQAEQAPQQGSIQTLAVQPEQLPVTVLGQQQAPVSQLVNVPPPSLAVPPPQLVQQPPPAVSLPPPGVHIPAHQGPLVPQTQGVLQQQVLQQSSNVSGQIQQHILAQPPPSVSQAPGSTAQQTQAFITHATYPIQYIQAANGQTIMAYQAQPQVKADGQVQLIQQPGQLQLIPGTQQLLMQQPQQQVTMLLQYPQQNEAGKGTRLLAAQQRPVQIQLQPGVQLINPQLLQSGQTQFQLQLQQPLTQQLLQQAVRAVVPQQVTLQQPRHQIEQQHIQLQQQQILQLQHQQQQTVQLQLSQPQIQQLAAQSAHQSQLQQPPQAQQTQHQLQQQQTQHQLQQSQQTHQSQQSQQSQQTQHQAQQSQQTQHPSQQSQQTQHSLQQSQQTQHPLQQSQQTQHSIQHPQQTQHMLQQQQQTHQLQQTQQLQQQSQQTQLQLQQQVQQQVQQQLQQQQQQLQQPQHLQQVRQLQHLQQLQQPQQPMQQTQSQMTHQIQQVPHYQNVPQQQQIKQPQLGKEVLPQNNQQLEKPTTSINHKAQHTSPTRAGHSPQHGQKRRYEEDQPSNMYQGPPQPVPPPKGQSSKVDPNKQPPAIGIGNGPNPAQKPAGAPMQQMLPQIQKQLMPPPPPPQQGAPDDWHNNHPDQMAQGARGEHHPPPGGNVNRQERPTFNHYSSKPQLYNANMPYHVQGLGTYPPPPPPPPPGPFYSQQTQGNQYPYFMMHHQQ